MKKRHYIKKPKVKTTVAAPEQYQEQTKEELPTLEQIFNEQEPDWDFQKALRIGGYPELV